MFNKPTDLPIEQVKAMKAKGLDNNQIVQTLQRNGYSSTQVFDALNQADLTSGAPLPPGPPPLPDPPLPPSPGSFTNQPADPGNSNLMPAGGVSDSDTEELVESIIEEKWAELAKDINKIVEWKNDVEIKINKLEQRFESLKDDFDKVHQAIMGKVGEYDKNILTVGAEVKAMEKVFSKVLPVFTENVSELNRITQNIKKGKK